MLSKLLKYDLKYMIKNMSIFYILAVFFAILTRILFSLKETVIINVLGQISVGCMFSMMASILFNTVIRSYVRFKDSIYKDESYLTHTLPVTKIEIYESRFLEAVIFSIIGFLIIVVSLFIAYYTPNRYELLREYISSLSINNVSMLFIIISCIIILFLEIINIIQSGFLGMIIGFNKNNNKVGYSFLYSFISYAFSQIFVVVIIFIVGLFNSGVMSIFTSSTLNDSLLKLIIYLSILIYTIIIIIMNYISCALFNKGVNVE